MLSFVALSSAPTAGFIFFFFYGAKIDCAGKSNEKSEQTTNTKAKPWI